MKNLNKFLKLDLNLPTIEKTLTLIEELLVKVKENTKLDKDAKDAWNHELKASKARIQGIKDLFITDPTHETTHKDRTAMLIQLNLAQQYVNLMK